MVRPNGDQTPPLVSIASPADGSSFTTGSVAVSGLASDSLSGIANISCNNSPATVLGTNFNCDVPLQPGTNPISVRITDVAGNNAIASISANLSGPKVIITSPAALDLFAVNAIQVTGLIDDPNVSVVVNGVSATVANGAFTTNNVPLREGNNLITATGINAAGGVGSASVNVVLDTTPPTVRIDSPADKAILTVPQINVTGLVNDVVTGTVNSAQVSVVVNGVPSEVANRSFRAPAVLLVPGANLITATATDRAGNVNVSQVTVIFQDPANQQRIVMISGGDQSGAIGTTLPQPLVVELMNALGQPIVNAPVTF
ncbi:MAG TPA: Ig-like domain-containing protein, partial [Candidatus Angelobacter sp.]